MACVLWGMLELCPACPAPAQLGPLRVLRAQPSTSSGLGVKRVTQGLGFAGKGDVWGMPGRASAHGVAGKAGGLWIWRKSPPVYLVPPSCWDIVFTYGSVAAGVLHFLYMYKSKPGTYVIWKTGK